MNNPPPKEEGPRSLVTTQGPEGELQENCTGMARESQAYAVFKRRLLSPVNPEHPRERHERLLQQSGMVLQGEDFVCEMTKFIDEVARRPASDRVRKMLDELVAIGNTKPGCVVQVDARSRRPVAVWKRPTGRLSVSYPPHRAIKLFDIGGRLVREFHDEQLVRVQATRSGEMTPQRWLADLGERHEAAAPPWRDLRTTDAQTPLEVYCWLRWYDRLPVVTDWGIQLRCLNPNGTVCPRTSSDQPKVRGLPS